MNCRKKLALWSSIAALVLAVFIIVPAQAWDNHDTVVKTDYGKLKGYVNEDKEVMVWKGVPYAKPPVGDLRWAAPEDPDPWHGVRDAILPAKKCTQLDTLEEWINTGLVDSNSGEDCLYVDIYRPKRPTYHMGETASLCVDSRRLQLLRVRLAIRRHSLGDPIGRGRGGRPVPAWPHGVVLPPGDPDGRRGQAFRLGEFRNPRPRPGPEVDSEEYRCFWRQPP